MKRILCVLLAILLLTPAVFAADPMTLSVSQVEGEVGDKVTVIGKVENAPSCASFRVILTYDNKCLKLLSGQKGSGISGNTAINTNASYQNKPAVVTLAAKASQALVGNAELFVLEFEIIGEPAGTNYTALTVAHQEFFNENLSKVTPTVVSGKVTYPSLPVPSTPPASGEGETTTPGGETTTPGGETTTPGGETTTPGGNTTTETTPAPEKEPETNNNYKEPDGDWIVAGDQFAHVDKEGNANLYEGEFKDEEPKNPGDKAEVILKDEDGNEAGSVIVEKEDDGTLTVVGEDLGDDKMPVWAWILIGGAIVLVGAAAVVGYLYFQKKKAVITE